MIFLNYEKYLLMTLSTDDYKTILELREEIVEKKKNEGSMAKPRVGGLYVTIDRLVEKGYVKSRRRSINEIKSVLYGNRKRPPMEYKLLSSGYQDEYKESRKNKFYDIIGKLVPTGRYF